MNFSVKKQELCIICTKLSRKGKESSSWGHNAPQNESNTHVLGQRRHIEPNMSTFGAKIARKGQKMPLLRSRGDESLYLEERWSEMGKYFYFWSLNAQNRQKNVCIWGPNGQRGKRIPIFGKFFKPKFPSLSQNSILRAQIPFSEPKFLSPSPNSLKQTQIPNSEPNILHQAQSLVALMATFSPKYQ